MVKKVKELAKQEQQAQTCTICIEHEANARIDHCVHVFCFKCISKWSKKKATCPICRKLFTKIMHKKRTIDVKDPTISQPRIQNQTPRRTVYLPFFFVPVQPTFYFAPNYQYSSMSAEQFNFSNLNYYGNQLMP